MRYFLPLILLLASIASAATPYPTPNQPSVTVKGNAIDLACSSDGLDVVTLKPATVVTAAPTAIPWMPGLQQQQGLFLTAPPAWTDAEGMLPLGTLTKQTVALSGATGQTAVVTHVYLSNVSATYSYTLASNDIDITATITNGGAAPFDQLYFQLPAFQFGAPPAGNAMAVHPTYLAAQGWLNLAHAGTNPVAIDGSPLAVSYAYNANFGVALYCKSHFGSPVLINCGWLNNQIPAVMQPCVYVQGTVQPGQSATVQLVLRVAGAPTLAGLVGGYVSDFKVWAGAMAYKATQRAVIQSGLTATEWKSAASPLGFQSGRRLDDPAQLDTFEQVFNPVLGLAQGVICWQGQGMTWPGVGDGNYLPDFDQLPGQLGQTWPAFAAWGAANGFAVGQSTRPASEVQAVLTSAGTNTYNLIPVDVTNAAQLQTVVNRFRTATMRGESLYYADSFGADGSSYQALKAINAAVSNAVIITEYGSDLSLKYAGLYSEQAPGATAANATRYYSADTLKIFRMIWPQSLIVCKFCDQYNNCLTPTAQQCVQYNLTPLIEDSNCATAAPMLKTLNGYLDTNGQWTAAAQTVAAAQP